MEATEVETLVEGKVKDAMRENNAELLRNISSMISQISAPHITNNVVSTAPTLKRKSNQEQFRYNSKVLNKVEEVESCLNSQNLPGANQALIEAKDLIKRRQKLVQLADSSELGWRVVAEYETNPIASDSEDEKRIFKAEARASRKVKADKAKKRPFRTTPYARPRSRPEASATVQSNQSFMSQQRPGLCFACGKQGHWKNECPQRDRNNNKISTNTSILVQTDFSESKHKIGVVDRKGQCENTELKGKVDTPVGRLRKAVSKWKGITDSSYILDVVSNGYKLPLRETPKETELRNNKSARENPDFVMKEIKSLLDKGVISEVTERPKVVNPLTVAYSKAGKARLVLDCRHVNPFLHMFKVKFEDIKVALEMFDPSSYVFTFDLKSAYHHIDIFSDHRTYLGFSWNYENSTKYFIYNSLPFGISTAGHIFTKVLRCVVKHCRAKGHRVIMFLDDGIGGQAQFEKAKESSEFVSKTLIELGFLLAEDKCFWTPKRRSEWLGHVLDFEENKLYITEERISRLIQSVNSLLFQIKKDNVNVVPVRYLASVTGQIISLQSVLGKVVCRMTKYLHKCIDSRIGWNCMVFVSSSAIEELRFWLNNVCKLNTEGKNIRHVFNHEICVLTDASAVGYGGYIIVKSSDLDLSSNHYSNTGKIVLPNKSGDSETAKVSRHSLHNTVDRKEHELRLPEESFKVNMQRFPEENQGFSDENEKSEISKLPEESYLEIIQGFPEVNQVEPIDSGCNVLRLPEVSCKVSELPEVSQRLTERQGTNGIGTYSKNSDRRSEGELSKLIVKGNEILALTELDITRAKYRNAQSSPGGSSVEGQLNRNIISGSEICGSWSEIESLKSSTWRELEALYRMLRSKISLIKNTNVKLYTDNKNIEYILESGSNIEELHRLCLNLHEICHENNISFIVEWIPRKHNVHADYLSRLLDCDDWSISDNIFRILDRKWGPHTIDRFSCHYNNKCERYNSRWWVPGTEAVNCLFENWEGEINWLVPPPSMVPSCIRKMQNDKCKCTLVLPEWKSAAYWPMLVNENGSYKQFVKDVYVLPSTGSVIHGIGLRDSIKRKIDETGIQINDEERIIKRLATHIISSRAEGTVTKYHYQVISFKEYCMERGFPVSPAFPIHVAMFLSHMIDSGKSDKVITSAFYAIKWLHNINGLKDPTDCSFVKNVLESAKRLNSKPVVKKDVISSENLIELCDKYIDSFDIIVHRDLSMILLSYAGFLRFSEVSELRCCDITFNENHLVLKIRKSKMDIYRSGKEVLIAKGASSACPYAMLRKYLDCAGLEVGSDKYVFQPACRSGSKCFLLNKDKKLSYTRARECILQKLRLVVPNLRLGTHSLRASGATVAANAEGVSDRCLKRHGRWKSDSAKDGYIEDSVEKKLFITKQLGL